MIKCLLRICCFLRSHDSEQISVQKDNKSKESIPNNESEKSSSPPQEEIPAEEDKPVQDDAGVNENEEPNLQPENSINNVLDNDHEVTHDQIEVEVKGEGDSKSVIGDNNRQKTETTAKHKKKRQKHKTQGIKRRESKVLIEQVASSGKEQKPPGLGMHVPPPLDALPKRGILKNKK